MSSRVSSFPFFFFRRVSRRRVVSMFSHMMRSVFRIFVGVVSGSRMVRRVGPGRRPEERHEFDHREMDYGRSGGNFM